MKKRISILTHYRANPLSARTPSAARFPILPRGPGAARFPVLNGGPSVLTGSRALRSLNHRGPSVPSEPDRLWSAIPWGLRLLGFLGFLTALLSPFTPEAHAHTAASILRVLSRPVPRLILQHTREGTLISRSAIGMKIRTEKDLRVLAAELSRSDRLAETDLLLARIRAIETEARAAMHAGKLPELAPWLEKRTSEILKLAAGEKISFVKAPAGRGFSRNRARFTGRSADGVPAPGSDLIGLDFPSLHAPGADLRFTRWRGQLGGNVSRADFRGADLRHALIDPGTNLRGALFDQFTRLPFTFSEARLRGMVYRGSTPTSSSLRIETDHLRGHIRRATKAPPPASETAPSRLLSEMPKLHPEEFRGVEPFAAPEHLSREGSSFLRFESGRIVHSDEPFLKRLIDEVHELGGEVRRLSAINPESETLLDHSMAYFRATPERGIIAIGRHTEPAALAHEMAHFRDWQALLGRYRSQGFDQAGAFERAAAEFNGHAFVRYTERNAVTAQIQHEAKLGAARTGQSLVEQPFRYENPELIRALNYPETEALARLFHEMNAGGTGSRAQLTYAREEYARAILRRGLRHRRNLYLNLKVESAAELEADRFFDELLSWTAPRYAAQGVLEQMRSALGSHLFSEVRSLPADAFRAAALESLYRSAR